MPSASTAWSTSQRVTSPGSGWPFGDFKWMVTWTFWLGRAFSGASRSTATRLSTGLTLSQAVAAMVAGLPRSVALPGCGAVPGIRPRISTKWTGTRGV